MAEGGHKEELNRSTLMGSEDAASNRSVTTATLVKELNFEDKLNSSTLMSPNKLIVSFFLNTKVILVDTGTGKKVSELGLPCLPWQVTRMSDTEAAVTIPVEQKILLLSIHNDKTALQRDTPQLSVVRDIGVKGDCYGIAYTDSTFIVSFDVPVRVDILDMSGKALRTITTDQTGRRIFLHPLYVAVDPASGSIFVSDFGSFMDGFGSRLVKLSMEGSVLATFETNGEIWPRQVALDTQGMVYVAWGDRCVYQLDANCNKVKTLIAGLSLPPDALSYDEATRQLHVGVSDSVTRLSSSSDGTYLFNIKESDGVLKIYRLSLLVQPC